MFYCKIEISVYNEFLFINNFADKARTSRLTPEEMEFMLNIQNLEGTLGREEIAPEA